MNDETKSVSLPKEAVLEFQTLYERLCGEKITYEKAESEGLNLLQIFRLVTKEPVRKMKDEYEKLHYRTE